MTGHNRAMRRVRRPPVIRSADATPDQSRLPPAVSSCPSKRRRGGPFRSKQKSFAAALCLRVRPEPVPASQVRHEAGPLPESQARRCKQRQSSVVVVSRQRKAVSSQAGSTGVPPAVARASRPRREIYAIRTAFVANAVVTDCAGFRCMRERSNSPSICSPSRSCACAGPSFSSAES